MSPLVLLVLHGLEDLAAAPAAVLQGHRLRPEQGDHQRVPRAAARTGGRGSRLIVRLLPDRTVAPRGRAASRTCADPSGPPLPAGGPGPSPTSRSSRAARWSPAAPPAVPAGRPAPSRAHPAGAAPPRRRRAARTTRPPGATRLAVGPRRCP